MPVLTENLYVGDWLKGEVEIPQRYSRDLVTLDNTSGTPVTLSTGTVLGKNTATGHFVALNPGASDGSQNAAGILLHTNTIPASGTLVATAITREATVSDTQITYPAGITGTQKTAAISALAANGIIVRRTV